MSDSSPVFIFSVSYLGDLVLATIALDRMDGRESTVVAAAAAASILQGDNRIARVETVSSSHPALWRSAVLGQIVSAKRRGALVINLEVYRPRWRFLRRWCAAARVRAVHIDLPGLAADNEHSARGEPVNLPHRAHYYAQAVGYRGEPPLPRLIVHPAASESVAMRIRALGRPDATPVVVIHPGSTDEQRRAPKALLAECARRLAGRLELTVAIVGTEREREACAALALAMAPTVNTANWVAALSLTELAALLQHAQLFLGGDSGPLKVAEAVGAPTLSFWGPTGGEFAGPRGSNHRMVRFESNPDVIAQHAFELLQIGRLASAGQR